MVPRAPVELGHILLVTAVELHKSQILMYENPAKDLNSTHNCSRTGHGFLCRLKAEVDGLGIFANDDASSGIVPASEKQGVVEGGHTEATGRGKVRKVES